MKVIAFYLPQFHTIPENEMWWGKDFTDWDSVRNAKPLFLGHNQPKVPLNRNYYNLLENDIKVWQARLAKQYGIYGFCYYHYWFEGKLLLEKPMEQMLKNKRIDLPFCICWANDPWTRAWVGEKKTIVSQKYGDKTDWKKHFYYLLDFFKDERYIKEENAPLLIIYKPEIMECVNEMMDYWNELALDNGFSGLTLAYQSNGLDLVKKEKRNDSRFRYDIEFQPAYAFSELNRNVLPTIRNVKLFISTYLERKTGKTFRFFGTGRVKLLNRVDYISIWEKIVSTIPESEKNIPGAFVDWDNTPRHGNKGRVYIGGSPETFKKYFDKQIKRAKSVYKKDMLFIFAWNEWAEGGFLEPDEKNQYRYLESIRDVLIRNNEFPWQ